MQCVDKADIKTGTKVLIRCDLDVPIKNGEIVEAFRLDAGLKTLNYIIDLGGIPVIVGHIGRPEGKVVPELSTSQLKPYFDKNLLGRYELLENLRFDPREEANDSVLAKELAQKASIYVNESFANSLREHMSMVKIPKLLPSYAGFQLVKEVESLKRILVDPARPLLAVIGGAKIESKKPVIQKFAQIADGVLVGGRLALEEPIVLDLKILMDKVYYPVDYIDDKDIGPKTLEGWRETILNAKTIVWAGPMGLFENDKYSMGTRRVGELVADAVNRGCFAVAGGGDTVTALNKFGLFNKFSFVSTGGSAMLDFLVYGTLPGIKALCQRN
ncbi:MAG: phosphoglycerate kinase [Patescibacteria group bacterium]